MILYRYTDVNDCVVLDKYHVIRETPKGKWVAGEYDLWRARDAWPDRRWRKFILNEGRKRFAHETTEAALAAFFRRKQSHLDRLKFKIELIEAAIKRAESGEFGHGFTRFNAW